MIGFGSESTLKPSRADELDYKKAHALLSSPRMSGLLKLPSGEQITYAEVGQRTGIPCFWVGGPCSNRLIIALYSDVCTELGVRLISFDRPGRGGSSPLKYPKDWTFASYSDYLKQVADMLQIDEFFLIGHSFGSSYAYAASEILKDRVKGCLRILATWAPSNLPCMPSAYALQRSIPTSLFRAVTSFTSNPTFASLNYQLVPMQMGSIGNREHPVIHNAFVREVLERINTDHLGDSFPAYELDWMLALEIRHKFPYDHKKLKASIKCWHGMDDTIAPLGAAMWMQRETDHFLLYAVEGATHNIHLDFAITKAMFADLVAENMTIDAKREEELSANDVSNETAVNETEVGKTDEQVENADTQPSEPLKSLPSDIPGLDANVWQ